MLSSVLIIEDDPDIRLLAKLSLQQAGHDVFEAETGEEGLDALDSRVPDVILLDIRLPGVDGWKVLESVRRSPELRAVTVIMMSAHSSGHTVEIAKARGADGYIVKPFRQDELLQTIGPSETPGK